MGAGIVGIPGMAVTGALLEAGAIMAAALRGRARARAPVAMGTASGPERGAGPSAGAWAASPVPPLPRREPGQPGTPSRCPRETRLG